MQATPEIEHLVGHREGVGEGGLLVGDAEEVLVRDDDQRVDAGPASSVMPGSATRMRRAPSNWNGLVTTPTVRMPCSRAAAGDDRRGAGAGAAAHAGGDEDHVRAVEVVGDLVDRLLGGGAADLRLRAGAETLGDGDAHLDQPLGLATTSAPGESVLATTNSQPIRPERIMLLTALPPAPPTPKTVIFGFSSLMSGIFRLIVMVTLVVSFSPAARVCRPLQFRTERPPPRSPGAVSRR